MNPHLPAFIHTLEDRGLLKFDILGERDLHFDNRFMIQKYVFLARHFNLDMGYSFGMYLHGPYSSTLANDYYNLAKIRDADEAEYRNLTSKGLDGLLHKPFFEFVDSKDQDWLEAATTLLSLRPYFNDRRRLLERTANMKDHIPGATIESILGTLERQGLIASSS